jgi:ABC-type glycerol-3-phosphate transport system substrate-binding protein
VRHGLSRRRFLAGGAAAGAAAALGALGGCAGGAASGAKPAPAVQQPSIILGMRAWGVGSGATGSPKTIDSLLYDATQPWRATHPGVDIRIIENTGGPQAVITSIIAGNGPDIYHSWHPQVILASPDYTTDLTPYLKQSNADLSAFNKAQMNNFITPTGIRALPYYLGIMALAVNESLLDSLGLAYPAAGWTYQDYGSLTTSIARGASNGKRLYGSDFSLGQFGELPDLPPDCIFQGFGGSIVMPGDPTKCNLGSAQSIAAMQWVYDLVQAKAIDGPGGGGSFGSTLGMTFAPSFFLPQAATGWKGFKWSYYSPPAFPATGPATAATIDLWAMNPASQNLDLAWDLLHWCTFEPDWQRSQMDIFLLSPALVSLWEEWLTRVPQIAPPLADKNLKVFADLAAGGHAYAKPFFRYNAVQAETLINSVTPNIWSGKLSVQAGLTQLAQQLDALEVAGASEQTVTENAAKQFPTAGTSIASVPSGI